MTIPETQTNKEVRFFSFPTEIESIVDMHSSSVIERVISNNARTLYDCYEQDFLYLPSEGIISIQTYLGERYKTPNPSFLTIYHNVFDEFDKLIDTIDWRIKERDVIEFFWYRIEKETHLITENSFGNDYIAIANMPNKHSVCRYMMSQFALDYLTEASPLTRMLPGTYGEVQMAIFKIVADEYGNGTLENKHSVLFQNTLRSLQMSDDLNFYRNDILPSVYMYMCYVNRVASEKQMFLRFLGFLFVYEACLIYPTQQQGRLLRHVFGEDVDTKYFDLHVEIDQGHGVWCVEKILIPIIREYGVEAAREILRGYHETLALLSACDFEIMNQIDTDRFPQHYLHR